MPTRIVIVGASGNIGTALLKRLAAAGGDYELHGVARRRPPPVGVYQAASWHQLDVAEQQAVTRLQRVLTGADCVVHLAWAFQPTRNTRYLDAVGINGSKAVLAAARAAGVGQLVHMSSVGTYAAGRYGQRVDESWSTAGIATSPYSRAKSAVEALLDDYQRGDGGELVITRMRPGFVMQRDAASGLRRYTLPAYIDTAWLRLLPVLPLDRSLTIPVVHADDVADAVVRSIERRAGGPFNLSAEPPVRRDDVAHALGAKAIHLPWPILRVLVQASWLARLQPIDQGWLDLAFSVPLLDTHRARTQLDWTPQHNSLDAIAELIDGFIHHSATPSPVLATRSFVNSIRRDLSNGPITTRKVP
ncbi:MAG: NAD-dependent epimerase/dehydratase family protein [Mycobacterium sp.]|nr:NAD-dependent epimerase/dehydratase family protein [Mycobacterium sp.]MBV9353292.1 NAD-dependent epimerase/dehydratase family protein [Mycobacterium sp.]